MVTLKRRVQFFPRDLIPRESDFYTSPNQRKIETLLLQMEISFLLQIHWPFFFRTSQVARFRLPFEVYLQECHGRYTPSLFAKEHLHPGQVGEPFLIKAFTCGGVTLTLHFSKLSIQPLRELAFRDIESKLSERNIVNEFFSHFSARWSSFELIQKSTV